MVVMKFKQAPVLALATALGYCLANCWLVNQGQFHEDAYILFNYVDNILSGHGIAYYPGGPRAEGATDFLWMLLLVAMGKVGVDAGSAAILLNGVGVYVMVYLLAREIASASLPSKAAALALYPFAVFWLFSDPLLAAVGGFSVYLYSALVLLTTVNLYRERYLLFTPLWSIVIALFRPDGVILGVLYTLLGLWLTHRGGRSTRTYLLACLAAAVIGLSYFCWRWHYFGNLLPLPLYVKSSAAGLAGLDDNLAWLRDYRFMLIPLALLGLTARRADLPRMALLVVPPGVLFLALLTATQSQNVGYRFQAPLFIALYYVLVLLLIDAARRRPLRRLALLAYVLLLAGFVQHAAGNVRKCFVVDFRPDYMGRFATALPDLLPKGSTIALTEAGQLAYWTSRGGFELHDIVGLNTPYAAKNAISVAYLDGLSPDLLMYHEGRSLDVASRYAIPFPPVLRLAAADNVLFAHEIDLDLIGVEGQPDHLYKMKIDDSKVVRAELVSSAFLSENFDQYDIFLVHYRNKDWLEHVYAVKKALNLGDEFYALLLDSARREDMLSHYQALERR